MSDVGRLRTPFRMTPPAAMVESLEHRLLRVLGRRATREDPCSGAAYRTKSKLETLLGRDVWRDCAGISVDSFEHFEHPDSALRLMSQLLCDGGMTVRRFEALCRLSGFLVEHFEAVPIRRARYLSTLLTREFLTSVVKCPLALPTIGTV